MNEPLPAENATPIERLARPFQEFAKLEASGGILLIGCTIIALTWANSPWAESYHHLWHTNLTFGFAGAQLSEPLHFWINDGLMALFFLLVGLEIKRELLVGELASLQKAALPIAAAVGGLTIDPAMPEALRMRRFYVRKRFRRCGIGRQLALALLERAAAAARPVTVNAGSGSEPFWTALGFIPDPRDGHTHVLKQC